MKRPGNWFTPLIACVLLALPGASQAQLYPEASTVLVTGANRGIGLEFVRQFGERGWNVIATTRSLEGADELQALAAGNPRIVVELLDVTDFAAIDALAGKYAEQPIDILLNNAAITPRDPSVFRGLRAVDFDLARRSLEVNALAPLRMSQAFLDQVAASEGRRIVMLSSKAGSFAEGPEALRSMPMMYEYRASKAALNMFVQNLSWEGARQQIITVALSPGTVNTTPGVSMPGAIEPEESVRRMLAVIDGLTADHNGLFLNYENGEVVGW
ncbi:MAG: SDR family oxidoreductase [Chromatiales bacterium]|nr:SDR family oxidoreductase [Chromatiales bacterium]